jgi:multisubunit Na+/H+ antiporter MnhB subunit
MGNQVEKKSEDRSGHLVGGTILIGVGLIFLLINLDVVPGLEDLWPIFIIIVGAALIVGSLARGRKSQDI